MREFGVSERKIYFYLSLLNPHLSSVSQFRPPRGSYTYTQAAITNKASRFLKAQANFRFIPPPVAEGQSRNKRG
jgi:hypothetical protein